MSIMRRFSSRDLGVLAVEEGPPFGLEVEAVELVEAALMQREIAREC
jgi:hypothetical protein